MSTGRDNSDSAATAAKMACHGARRAEGKLNLNLVVAKIRGGLVKSWTETLQEDLAMLSGNPVLSLRRWNQDWVSMFCKLTQDRHILTVHVQEHH